MSPRGIDPVRIADGEVVTADGYGSEQQSRQEKTAKALPAVANQLESRASRDATVPVYYCMACPEAFNDAATSNAHHDATGHNQTWKPSRAFAARESRALDALVAEKVMGYRITWLPTALMDRVPHYTDSRHGLGYLVLPAYSTNIADAWLIVERMRPRFWTKIGAGMRIDTGEPLHECAMGEYATEDTPSRQLAYERDVAIPLAICRAALATLRSPR